MIINHFQFRSTKFERNNLQDEMFKFAANETIARNSVTIFIDLTKQASFTMSMLFECLYC